MYQKRRLLKATFPFIFVLLVSSFSFGQYEGNYIPLAKQSDSKEKILRIITERYKLDQKTVIKPYSKEVLEIYKKRYNLLKDRIEAGEFIFDHKVSDYVNNIFNVIRLGNPSIPSYEIRVLVSRSHWPNAVCIGEGTIIIHMGLIRKLKSEAELAFVLSHEVAHYSLDHGNKGIREKVNKLYNKSAQKELKEIQQEVYNRFTKLKEFYEDKVYDLTKHHRYKESQADSLALIYLSNTEYSNEAAIHCLQKLDSINYVKYGGPINFEQIFQNDDYPIKSRWYEKEESIFEVGEKVKLFDDDSLKTHPDCQKRIASLKQNESLLNQDGQLFIQKKADFDGIVSISDFEIIQHLLAQEDYSIALWHALKLTTLYPKNIYLKSVIGNCLYSIQRLRKNHQLGRVVPYESPDYIESYNATLRLIHQPHIKELVNLNYFYLANQPEKYREDEYFLYTFVLACHALTKLDEFNLLKNKYLQQFPNGKFISQLNSL